MVPDRVTGTRLLELNKMDHSIEWDLKRKVAEISRSQYEVYSFSTKHNLSEAAVDELLWIISNVTYVSTL